MPTGIAFYRVRDAPRRLTNIEEGEQHENIPSMNTAVRAICHEYPSRLPPRQGVQPLRVPAQWAVREENKQGGYYAQRGGCERAAPVHSGRSQYIGVHHQDIRHGKNVMRPAIGPYDMSCSA